jgi:hypothetical protein
MAIPTGSSTGIGGTGLGKVSKSVPLRYPNNAIYDNTDYVRFDFYKYKPAFSDAGGTDISAYNMSLQELEATDDLSSIYLYMPEDVSADYGASWGGKSFSNIGAGILKTIGPTMKDGNAIDGARNMVSAIGEQVEGFGPALAASLVSKALNEIPGAGGGVSVDDVLSGTRGVILNPNAELMFDKAEMRNFSLSFKLVPRNSTEAEIIKKICTDFKKATLPKFGGEGLLSGITGAQSSNFIGVPNIVDVNFMTGSSLNRNVSQYKPCAITQVKINYTPDGVYSTNRDGSPIAIGLDLSFSELKVLYRNEITNQGWSY